MSDELLVVANLLLLFEQLLSLKQLSGCAKMSQHLRVLTVSMR